MPPPLLFLLVRHRPLASVPGSRAALGPVEIFAVAGAQGRHVHESALLVRRARVREQMVVDFAAQGANVAGQAERLDDVTLLVCDVDLEMVMGVASAVEPGLGG